MYGCLKKKLHDYYKDCVHMYLIIIIILSLVMFQDKLHNLHVWVSENKLRNLQV